MAAHFVSSTSDRVRPIWDALNLTANGRPKILSDMPARSVTAQESKKITCVRNSAIQRRLRDLNPAGAIGYCVGGPSPKARYS